MALAGLSPIIGAVSALVVWALHFLVVYGAQATICARGLASDTVFGMAAVPAMIVIATILALAVVGIIGLLAWRRLRDDAPPEQGRHFARWMAATAAPLAALAILWEALPVLILPSCG